MSTQLSETKDNAQTVASNALPKSGGTMTGNISIPAFHGISATKSTDVPTFTIPSSGKPMFEFFQSASISEEASCRLQGIATPQYNSDAANKAYVDSKAGSSINTGNTYVTYANIYYNSTSVLWSGVATSHIICSILYPRVSSNSEIGYTPIPSTFFLKRGTLNYVVALQTRTSNNSGGMQKFSIMIDFTDTGNIILHQNSTSVFSSVELQIYLQAFNM